MNIIGRLCLEKKIESELWSDNLEIIDFLMQESANAIFLLDEMQIIRLYNKKIIGAKELIGKSFSEIIKRSDKEKYNQVIDNLKKGEIKELKLNFKHKLMRSIKLKVRILYLKKNEDNYQYLIIGEKIPGDYPSKEKRFQEMMDDLTEIRFWKFFQPKKCSVALEESNKILSTIIEHTPQCIAWIDANLIFLGCNQNYANLMGEEGQKNLIGKTFEDLNLHPRIIARLRKNCIKVIETGKAEIHKEERWETGLSDLKWYDVNRIPFTDIEDNIVGLLISYENITERKKAEKKLVESEEKFRDLTELLPDVIYEADPNSTLLYSNRMGLKKFGLTKEKIEEGVNIFDLFHPSDKEKAEVNFKKLIKGEKIQPNEYLMSPIKGEPFYGVVHSTPVFKDGKIIKIRGILHDVSERKEAVEKLRESEYKYRNLVETMNEGVGIQDEKGFIQYVNRSLCEILGYHEEELIGMNSLDLLDKRNQLIFKEHAFGKDKTNVEPYELVWQRKGGGVAYTIISPRPLYNKDDSLKGSFAVISDITEKKITESKLKASETKYLNLISNVSDVILELDTKGKYRYLSPQCKDLFGFDPQELVGTSSFKNIHPDDFQKSADVMRNSMRIMGKAYWEFRARHKDGYWIPVSASASLTNIDGEFRIVSVLRDIRSIKKAERKIEESEKRYRHLFESSPYAIFLLTTEGMFKDCNSAGVKLFPRLKKEKMIENSFSDVIKNYIPQNEKYLEGMTKEYEKMLREGNIEPLEYKLARSDGEEVWLDINCTLISLNNESFIQAIVQDVTEKKIAEEKLRKSERQLRELNKDLENKVMERTRDLVESQKKLREQNIELKKLDKVKNFFITMAAHELKTPLISISGYTDYILMKYEGELNDDIINDLNVVQKNIDRLQKLMDQLLEVMKIDENRLKLNRRPSNVVEIINECISELSYLIKQKNQNILLEFNSFNKIVLDIDPERIFQVFSNLISNAVKFSQKNQSIEIHAEKQGVFYLFSIKDYGIGLTEENMSKIFNKFEMIDQNYDSNYHKGTGLGLYITKGFIEAHEGKIWVESRGRNKGSTFFFTLPTYQG